MGKASVLGTNSEGLKAVEYKTANAMFIAGAIILFFIGFISIPAAVISWSAALGMIYAKKKIMSKWKKQ